MESASLMCQESKGIVLHTETLKKSFILENTRVVEPLLCPEVKLRLITPECPLWSATEQDLAALPIASPYRSFCWAGGQGLARYILDQAELVAGKRVFAFGAGCGIEAIAAAKAGADFCPGFRHRSHWHRPTLTCTGTTCRKRPFLHSTRMLCRAF